MPYLQTYAIHPWPRLLLVTRLQQRTGSGRLTQKRAIDLRGLSFTLDKHTGVITVQLSPRQKSSLGIPKVDVAFTIHGSTVVDLDGTEANIFGADHKPADYPPENLAIISRRRPLHLQIKHHYRYDAVVIAVRDFYGNRAQEYLYAHQAEPWWGTVTIPYR